MALPPKSRRISTDDYPEAPEWFQSFVGVLSPFMTYVADSLTKPPGGPVYKTVSIVTSDSPAAAFPIRLSNPLPRDPVSVQVAKVVNQTPGDLPAGLGIAQWQQTAPGVVYLVNLWGLSPNCSYDVTLAFA